MERPDFPDFGHDVSFSYHEAARFQAEVVWPALDLLWGGDFRAEAIPDCGMTKEVPVYKDRDDVWCAIELGCEADDEDYDYDEENDTVLFVNLVIYKKRDELLPALINGYKTERIQASLKNNAGKFSKRKKKMQFPELQDTDLSVREISSYSFSPVVGDGFTVLHNFELRNSDQKIWDTDTFVWMEDGLDKSESAETEIEELNDVLENTITSEDYFMIMDAFRALGVNPEDLANSKAD